MLLIAGGIALALRGRPARLRAVIWGTALVGSLLIPLAATVVPVLPVVLPVEIPQLSSEDPRLPPIDETHTTYRERLRTAAVAGIEVQAPHTLGDGWNIPPIESVLMTIWAALALVFFAHQLSGLWRMAGIIRRARPITDEAILDLFADVCAQVGCRRRIRLVTSSELDIPAVFGIFWPVVILPVHSRTWLEDRLMRILNRSKHRKVGLAVILPATFLIATLVPAIAAVQPTEPGPRQAGPELKAVLTELEEAERRIEPTLERISEHELELQPVMEEIEAVEIVIDHEAMARIEAEMKPFQEEMEQLQKEMEPFQKEMERMGERIEAALHNDVAAVLRSHLEPVTSPNAPFTEAAAHIVEDANIHIDNDVIELDVSRREIREILSDLFTPSRIGTQDVFDDALENAVSEISDLEIRTD